MSTTTTDRPWRPIAVACAVLWLALTIAAFVLTAGRPTAADAAPTPTVPSDVTAVAELALAGWLESADTPPSPDLFLGSVAPPETSRYAARVAVADVTGDAAGHVVELLATVLTLGDDAWIPDGVHRYRVHVVPTADGPRATGTPELVTR